VSCFTYNILKNNNIKNKSSVKKLSSGLRINNAADDAAGLAISEKMRAQIRGLNQASRNVQDFISMTQTIDAGLNEATKAAQRMRELSIEALSDTLTDQDREMINKEYVQLREQIESIRKYSEFNTIPVYEQHKSIFKEIGGNKELNNDITVVEGITDYLGVFVDGNLQEIHLESGNYTKEDFIDMLDDKLWEVDKDIIVHFDDEDRLHISGENYKNISLIGGAAGFFYEYHIGRGVGVVFGKSDLSGKLDIIKGSNDNFTFTIYDKKYNVNFPPTPYPPYMGKGYTADEIVNIMQEQLDVQGANVKVFMNGNNIALDAGDRIIDGFAGNMIKIDGITSILYDNAKHGAIHKTKGYTTGRVSISSPIEIKKGVNDTISFYLDGDNSSEKNIVLEGKTYNTIGEIVDEVNKKLEEQNIEAFAEASGTNLKISSKKLGYGSKIKLLDTANGYDTFFRKKTTTTNSPYTSTGRKTTASIIGRHGIESSTIIDTGVNDTIKITVDGTTKDIVLDANTYSHEELIDEINKKLEEKSLNITASMLTSGGKGAIKLTYKEEGTGSISISPDANGYIPLFCEITEVSPTYNNGETIAKPPLEGSTTPTYEYKPAYVMSGNSFNGITIDGSNDKLNFNVSGTNASVNLTHGRFNSINEFKDSLQKSIDNAGIENVQVKIYNSNKIGLETKEKGKEQYFSGLSGNGYKDIFVGESIHKPYSSYDTGTTTYSYIQGRSSIGNNFEINSTNKDLSFDYIEDGKTTNVSIELEEKTYATREELINEINNKLGPIPITAKGCGSDAIELIADNGGSNYRMKNFLGGFYDNIFKSAVESVILPDEGDGYTNSYSEQQCYIVGRKDISNGVVINPNINDVLTFDLSKSSSIVETVSLQITPEHYTPKKLVDEINKQLDEKGISYVRAEYGTVNTGTTTDDSNKLVLRYINEENGSYVIDGIRGNSAYSIFYDASGEPTPTYTVGVLDLSRGVDIVKGENDTFIFDVNEEKVIIELEEGKYTSEELLAYINEKLEEIDVGIDASYFEGRLKLGFKELGYNTIDNIRGNAAGTLFFSIDSRKDPLQYHAQIGSNAEDLMDLDIFHSGTNLLRINTTRINNKRTAEKSLTRIDYALNLLSSQKGRVGAYQNRLESIYRNNENYAENLQASQSRITDLDMAKEVMEFVKTQILGQVSQAMLAQSNGQSQRLIQLFLDRK